MNVASINLCKELYELSSWDDTAWYYFKDKLYTSHEMRGQTISEYNPCIPAYDLGYLLRKLHELPFSVSLNNLHNKEWTVLYQLGAYIEPQTADTPENAVAMLAIELFKKRILKREDTKNG